MENSTENLLIKKYESLLKGILPESYKDHILNDKLNLLYRENANLEHTVKLLRHEISNLIEKKKFDDYDRTGEKVNYKFYTLSSELEKCLATSGCEVSSFSKAYDQAIQALAKWNKGFAGTVKVMRSRLYMPNRQLLDFMHNVLDELHNLRGQLTIVQNYLAVLEFNETTLRDSLKKYESKSIVTRSVSVNRIASINGLEMPTQRVFEVTKIAHSSFELKIDELNKKINKIKLSFEINKNEKRKAEIETEKLLLQLKQTKEHLAFVEESAAERELVLKNEIRRLSHIVMKLKEMPKFEKLVEEFEKTADDKSKRHGRARSNIILYNT